MDHFPVIGLLGRPAAGKSEVIDFLKRVSPEERLQRFHIAPFVEIDDFPFVWQTFEDDDILTRHGKNRIWTDENYYFTDPFVWNLYIEKINLAYAKLIAEQPAFLNGNTVIVEFSRGGKDGFREAFSFLSREIVSVLSIVYINVSYEESCRKNRRRFRPEEAHSILYHSLPDDKMEFYYKDSDWSTLAPDSEGRLIIGDTNVPYAVLNNEPEVTLDDNLLGPALEKMCTRLWNVRSGNK